MLPTTGMVTLPQVFASADASNSGRKKFVVEITPYYYEHGVCLEDHDGTSAHLYTILISKQTYLRPFNTNKDKIKKI